MKSENKHIVVVGSINTDMTVKSGKLPRPGETVLGGVFFKNQGGKGANQAVAAARLGASVRMIAKVGKDAFGEESVASLAREGVDTAGILTDAEHPSGIAMILVDDRGENMISVASGANLALTPEELGAVEEIIRSAGIVLMQLEIPMPVIEYVARMAKQHGATVILNPAPAPKQQLPPELLAHVDILIPNQTEAELISGTAVNDYESAAAAAGKIGQMGVRTVIITMGAHGVFGYDSESGNSEIIVAKRVKATDTTAAGDCFCGALSVALNEGRPLNEALDFANRAAAISVTRRGAQPSLPYLHEMSTR